MTPLLERARLATSHEVTLGTLLERLARAYGRRRLVEEDGRVLTYREAAALVDRWAAGVHERIAPGDRVVLVLPNGYELFLACLAVSRAGGLPAPVNDQMRAEEVDHVVADADAALVVRDVADLEPAGGAAGVGLGRAVPAERNATAALFYTSGTTGKPKGVALTHRGLLGSAPAAALVPAAGEVVLALPFAHIMGFLAAVGYACSGIPVLSLRRFRAAEMLDAIEQRRPTMFIGVPAMYRQLLDAGAEDRNLKSVHVWLSGADVMPADLANRFRAMGSAVVLPLVGPVGPAVMAEGYGLAETAGAVAFKLHLGIGPSDVVGLPVPGYRWRVVDEDGRDVRRGQVGELWVRGPGVTKGYWGDAAASADVLTRDGWLRTGDLARRGVLGEVHFAGRSKDVIKRGGFSVYAVEVETVLGQHPAVAEAAVVGIPDDVLGEVPAAAVRLRAGMVVAEADLIAFAGEHLSSYKKPTRVVFVGDLPRTGTQKVAKRQLLPLFA